MSIHIDVAQGPAIVHRQEGGKSGDDASILVQNRDQGHGLLGMLVNVGKDINDPAPALRPPLLQTVMKIRNIRRRRAKDVDIEIVGVVRGRRGRRREERRRR
jgi:hypothetical protein